MALLPTVGQIPLPTSDAAPAIARAFVADVLADALGDVVDDTQLVASEIVTSALVRGWGLRGIAVAVDGVVPSVVVSVADREPPDTGTEPLDRLSRCIVDRVADRWGSGFDDAGRWTWAEMLRPV